ncbi:unnamed protein product [Caenorhabditis auriculariae]|uniref:STAS domain-containing protein n=1 Tax=Caenorhabditis auriculariae TaxID=2777116 RepID=A0A8S1H967_9PELO|nr:unnamed protein product [Caenorhabditis auriculariae]
MSSTAVQRLKYAGRKPCVLCFSASHAFFRSSRSLHRINRSSLIGLIARTVHGLASGTAPVGTEKLEVCNGETRRINEPLYIEYDSPIFYMNAGSLKKQVKDAVDEALLNNDQSEIHYVQRNAVVVEKAEELRVLFDMSKVPQIDYESAKSLLQLRSELRRKNVEFKVTKLTDNVRTFLARLPEDEARAIVEDTEPSEDDFKTAREI